MSLSATKGVDPAFVHLPLSDHRCLNDSCLAFQVAHNASQAAYPYLVPFKYGLWTTYFYIAVIFVFMVNRAIWFWNDRRKHLPQQQGPSIWKKSLAAWRSLTYRRFRGPVADQLGLPSAGVQWLFLAIIIFAIAICFAERPYYREHRDFGTPPLGVRTGAITGALTPIIFALSGKFNVITILTGIGYEKLNVIHRFMSYVLFIIGIAHTIPFFVSPLRDNGMTAFHKQFYKPKALEFSGTPTLGVLVFIVLFSMPICRRKAYELFVHAHVFAALTYLGIMFWHSNDSGGTWGYLYASVALYGFSVLGRVFYKNSVMSVRSRWFAGFSTTARILPHGAVKLQVCVPRKMSWRPGQHCYVRIPQVSVFDSHPFTIASAPEGTVLDTSDLADKNHRVLTFVIRRMRGFTQKLSNFAGSNPDNTLSAFIDGPYGSVDRRLESAYDEVMIVAGGGGITSSISWLLHLARKMRDETLPLKKTTLVWTIRRRSQLQWVEEELELAKQLASPGTLNYSFHVTGDHDEIVPSEKLSTEKEIDEKASSTEAASKAGSQTSSSIGGEVHFGRPDLEEQLLAIIKGPRTCVLCCGPQSMKIDMSNSVARAQKKVLKGKMQEIALYTETFGW